MIVNGKGMDIKVGTSVSELLKKLNLIEDKVVVELNYEILSKEEFAEVILSKEDRVEIVSFVGGG